MSNDLQGLNPQIREVFIGKRSLRKIKIYPLSLADQKRVISLIEEILNVYFEHALEGGLSQDKLPEFISVVLGVLGRNVEKLMGSVLDPEEVTPDNFFEETTSTQMSEILNIIATDNFEEPSKNLMSLVDRFKGLFLLKRQSQPSLNGMLNSDSNISSEGPLEKED